MMKYLYQLLSIIFVGMVSITNIYAAKLIALKGTNARDKEVSISWKDGSSGYKRLGLRDILSSPWNKDIVFIMWSEPAQDFATTGKINFYEMPLHIPTVRAPWLKDAWIIIYNDGWVRYDIGQGPRDIQIMRTSQKRKFEKEGWSVID